jgi:2-polyprenyl-3-methyl-5-hydroxy-6-metoxy-1,4-benzoquinol methylase
MCSGARYQVVFTELGTDILRCTNCGHVFSSFRPDPHYSEYWGEEVAAGDHYYWSKARARMHRDFFERFIVGRSGRLLDMGCGLGFFIKAMAPYQEWDAYGCEISPAAVRHAREHLGLRNVICSPLEDADLPRGSFDIVTMWDVLDHIPEPDPVLSRCHALLKEGGTFFIRTPNVATQLVRSRIMQKVQPDKRYLCATDHPHFYSVRSIRALLKRNGFARVSFMHLHPIGSMSETGWKAALAGPLKTMSFHGLRALSVCSGGHLNFDNLFVVARKGAAATPSPPAP